MNHLNKQLEANHSRLERYLDEQNRKAEVQKKLDRLGLGLLILCGLIGLYYCIANANTIFKKNNKENIGQLTRGDYKYAIAGFHSSVKDEKKQENTTEEVIHAFVSVVGSQKVGQAVHFHLDEYNEEVEYLFHFGNGESWTLNNQELAYAYDIPGSYEVVLEVKYQGETAIAYSKILTIAN